ncbi:MAG TPA: alpha/beta fold hydrolase [Burkholderiaceae bacterium]|jgi:predicted alpha/beta hydrolase|nr:alpha/beta fold hydrolase [Burkholderiaceae bacterium]
MHSFEVRTADGQCICAREFAHAGATRVVVIAPAMGVKQDYYLPFAQWLADQGFAAITFDYRGLGESAPRRLRGFRASIDDWALRDLPAVVDAAAARHPGLAMSYVGHSLGGQIFGLVPNRDRFDTVLTVASGSGYTPLTAARLRRTSWLLWRVIAPAAIALAGYFPGRTLRVVGDLPAGVMRQWRRWCMHPDYVGSEGPAVREQYARVRTPITALMFPDDEFMTEPGVRRLHSLYAGAPVRFELMQPQALGLAHIGHFGFFREKMRASLWPRTLEWLALAPPHPAH